MNGCEIGTPRYYEGICWLEKSNGLTVKYPKEGESFRKFWLDYVNYKDCSNTYYDHCGLMFVGNSVVLSPSEEAWENFVLDKLTNIEIAPIEYYCK